MLYNEKNYSNNTHKYLISNIFVPNIKKKLYKIKISVISMLLGLRLYCFAISSKKTKLNLPDNNSPQKIFNKIKDIILS